MTPSGLLQKDDVIVQEATGRRWRVIMRLGNDALYAVRMVPEGHTQWPASDRNRGYAIMTEAAYYLKHGWRVINDRRP